MCIYIIYTLSFMRVLWHTHVSWSKNCILDCGWVPGMLWIGTIRKHSCRFKLYSVLSRSNLNVANGPSDLSQVRSTHCCQKLFHLILTGPGVRSFHFQMCWFDFERCRWHAGRQNAFAVKLACGRLGRRGTQAWVQDWGHAIFRFVVTLSFRKTHGNC